MKEINYGSWLPKPILFIILLTGCFFSIIFGFIQITALKIMAGLLGILCFLFFLFLIIMYLMLNKNGKKIQHSFWDLVINRAKWEGAGKALDIGTGAGVLAIKLAQKYPKLEVVGIDNWAIGWNYSQVQCENNARLEGVSEQVSFIKSSAASLPFEDGEFDLVVSNFVLHEIREVKDKVSLIQEVIRVLKPEGKFVIQDEIYNKTHYGDSDVFFARVEALGLKEISLTHTNKELHFSTILAKFFYKGGLLCGQK